MTCYPERDVCIIQSMVPVSCNHDCQIVHLRHGPHQHSIQLFCIRGDLSDRFRFFVLDVSRHQRYSLFGAVTLGEWW